MVMLAQADINTEEVLSWQGLHLLHFVGSSCSQKTRIFLKLKGIDCELHHVDLRSRENYSDWFLGINPRGLVPVLVDNGQVIIESNDILLYLEEKYPEPPLLPSPSDAVAKAALDAEDNLHLDLRALSMRFVFSVERSMRSEEVLQQYEAGGTGTVGGAPDGHRQTELKFFRDMISNNGIPDEQVRTSVNRFRGAYSDLEAKLDDTQYLLGPDISVLDIAWYIYSVRLLAAGYPLHQLHPHVGNWFDALHSREVFRSEVMAPPPPE
ncbi:MAG: glutathione S-transferase family protein, partial [Pseudomonadota bacterium]